MKGHVRCAPARWVVLKASNAPGLQQSFLDSSIGDYKMRSCHLLALTVCQGCVVYFASWVVLPLDHFSTWMLHLHFREERGG